MFSKFRIYFLDYSLLRNLKIGPPKTSENIYSRVTLFRARSQI